MTSTEKVVKGWEFIAACIMSCRSVLDTDGNSSRDLTTLRRFIGGKIFLEKLQEFDSDLNSLLVEHHCARCLEEISIEAETSVDQLPN